MSANHSIIAKMFEEDVNNPFRGEVERQKNQIHLVMQLSFFLLLKNLLKGSYVTKNVS